ncbi:CoA pyrophosphatase [Corynebacterium sanguinis]|uniref:NUDIX hydrolase n=1 Tax=Corynebacterium sanguinis TaxID=2594913 RepID=UPI00223BF1B1|nr:CoA pyrophosphatase [Corynebacterium sanguinis]MCT2288629.1 CoA pyrophosphatase [Corynebacterium sanguinis]
MADVALVPELAPGWLTSMVAGMETSQRSKRAQELLSGRTVQRPERDDAAVLMLLTGANAAEAEILITHRTPTMRSHSGQMAFPGGRIDDTDLGPVDAALREAWEETGLERERVTPLAVMPSLTTAGGRRRAVRPVLAYSADPGSPYVASPVETDDVFFAPVTELLAPENRLDVGFFGFTGPAFWVNDYLVWGFTGVLLDVLFDAAGWATPYDPTVVPLRRALKRSRNGERHF